MKTDGRWRRSDQDCHLQKGSIQATVSLQNPLEPCRSLPRAEGEETEAACGLVSRSGRSRAVCPLWAEAPKSYFSPLGQADPHCASVGRHFITGWNHGPESPCLTSWEWLPERKEGKGSLMLGWDKTRYPGFVDLLPPLFPLQKHTGLPWAGLPDSCDNHMPLFN